MPSISRKNSSHHGNKKPYWHISNMFRRADHFGKEIPSFNLQGESNVTTLIGSICTSVIVFLTLSYSLLKIEQVFTGNNPDLSVVTELDYI